MLTIVISTGGDSPAYAGEISLGSLTVFRDKDFSLCSE